MTPKRIFISYARPDVNVVSQLEHFIRIGTGFETWFDKRNLLPGVNWRKEIEQEIAQAIMLITCLSRNSVDRTGYFQAELKLAIEQAQLRPTGEIFIVPVRLNPCPTPKDIAHLQVLDLFEEDATGKLLDALRQVVDRLHLDVGVRAPMEEHVKLRKAIQDYNADGAH